MSSTTRPLALITGASAGIGAAYAERLAANGWDLVVVGRRAQRLDALAQTLGKQHGSAVEVVAADLGTEDGIAAVNDLCRLRTLDLLVNNAGIAHYMPFIELGEAELQELIAVNILALTRHTHTTAQAMVERGSGAIITVASLLAFSDSTTPPRAPQRVVYAATKSYVVMFTRLLAEELAGTGVKVQVVCPGLVKTEFHSRQNLDLSSVPRLAPEDVVQASMVALERNEVVCIPTLADGDHFTRRDQAQGEMLRVAFPPELAPRYRSDEGRA